MLLLLILRVHRVEPLVPFFPLSDFEVIQELAVADSTLAANAQSHTQHLVFLLRHHKHKRFQHPAKIVFVQNSIVIIIKLVECTSKILGSNKIIRQYIH